MKKTALIGLVGALMIVFAGCAPTDVDTGADNGKVEADSKDSSNKANEKRFKTDTSTEALGVKVNIVEVVIKPDRLEVGMNLENTNSQQVSFYPDQGKAIIGDKQVNANMFMGGEIGGDIAAGVKQDGVLVFPTANDSKLDPKSIKEIKLDFGDVTSADFIKTEKATVTVKVK